MAADYDAALAELYQAPHGSFVDERKRLAAELKAAGDKPGAAALAKRGRPTISAWVVNQLWWHARDAFASLLESAARLRDGDLGATPAHRDALGQLRARAAAMLADAGHGATESTLRRVAQSVAAIAATGSWEPDPPGALAVDRDPPGFDAAMLAPTIAGDGALAAQRVVAQMEQTQRRAAEVAAAAVAARVAMGLEPAPVARVTVPVAVHASEAEADAEAEPEAEAEPDPEAEAEPEPEPDAEAEAEAEHTAPARAPAPAVLEAQVIPIRRAPTAPPAVAPAEPDRAQLAARLRAAKAELSAKELTAEQLRSRLADAKTAIARARAAVDELQAELDRD